MENVRRTEMEILIKQQKLKRSKRVSENPEGKENGKTDLFGWEEPFLLLCDLCYVLL
jgi:hypothetical protein